MIEGTSSPSSQSFPNSTHNPNLMFDETSGLSSKPITPPPIPTFKCPMTKFKMLQSQPKSMATSTSNLEASVEDREAMLRANVDVSIEKNDFKIRNLNASWECDVIIDEEFKVKFKKLLDLWLGPNSLKNTKI